MGNSVPVAINRYINSAYDNVLLVAENIDSVNKAAENIEYLQRYLGVYESGSPSERPDGSPLETGDFYYSDKATYYYNADDDTWTEFNPEELLTASANAVEAAARAEEARDVAVDAEEKAFSLIGGTDIGDYEDDPTFNNITDYVVFGRGTSEIALFKVEENVDLPYTVDSTTNPHPTDDDNLRAYTSTATMYTYEETTYLTDGQVVVDATSELKNYVVYLWDSASGERDRLDVVYDYTTNNSNQIVLTDTYPVGSIVTIVFEDIGQNSDTYLKKQEAEQKYGDHNKQANRGSENSHPASAISTTSGESVQNMVEAISGKNEILNPNFLIPSPDDITHPSSIATSYVAGTQIFSDVYAGDEGCVITYVDGRVNCLDGNYQCKVAITKGLEHVPVFIASVASYDGIPSTVGVSAAYFGDYYLVTVTPSSGYVYSVKFEQGAIATKHEVIEKVDPVVNAKSLTDALNNPYISLGDYIIASRFNDGSGMAGWDVVDADSVTLDGYTKIQSNVNPSLALSLRVNETVSSSQLGFEDGVVDDDRFDAMTAFAIENGLSIDVDVNTHISQNRVYTQPLKFFGSAELVGDDFVAGKTGTPTTTLEFEGVTDGDFPVTSSASSGDTVLESTTTLSSGDVVIVSNYPTLAKERRKEIAIVSENTGSTVVLNSGLMFTYTDITDFKITKVNWIEGVSFKCKLRNINLRTEYASALKLISEKTVGFRAFNRTAYKTVVDIDEFDGYQSDCRIDFNDSSRVISAKGFYHSILSTDPNGFIKVNQGQDVIVDLVVDSSNTPINSDWSVGLMFDQIFDGNATGYDAVPSRNISGSVVANGVKFAVFGSSDSSVSDASGHVNLNVVCRSGYEQVRLKNVDKGTINQSGGELVVDGARNLTANITPDVKPSIFNNPINVRVVEPYSLETDSEIAPFVFGLSSTGVGTYANSEITGERVNGKFITQFFNIEWSAHTGSGNIRVKLPVDNEGAINANRIISTGLGTDIPGATTLVYDSSANRFYITDDSGSQVSLPSSGSISASVTYVQ